MKFLQIVSLVLCLLKYSIANNISDDFHFRITNGQPVDPNLYYPIVSIQGKQCGCHICGGTIIKPNQILSVAHCFDEKPLNIADNVQVIIGTVDISGSINDSLKHMVEKIVNHKKYDIDTLINDIALVYLKDSILVNIFEQTRIPLERNELAIGTRCYILGWGYTSGQSTLDQYHLLTAQIRVFSMGHCLPYFYTLFMWGDADKIICAGSNTGQDTCRGDSGGPLICNNKLSGITSYSLTDCGDGPAVYTKITAYYDWIVSGRANKNGSKILISFLETFVIICIVFFLN